MWSARFHEYGGPEVLRHEQAPEPKPSDGEALVAVEACGVNHFDIDLREGVSRIPLELPHIGGLEAVGRVVEFGGATPPGHAVGERVIVGYEQACGTCEQCLGNQANLCPTTRMFGVSRPGGYAELAAVPVECLVPVGDQLSATQWAAVQIAFGTAWHLVVTRGALRPGETVLVNAAGSGVSSAALQIAVLSGATVIASAGSDAKLEAATSWGAEHTVNYRTASLFDAVMAHTDGRGVDMVVEHVGGDVFVDSVRVLRPDGRLVTCGGHGGEVAPLDLIELFRAERRIYGSRTWTRLELAQVLALVQAGRLKPVVDRVFPLAELAGAQQHLSNRSQYGKVVVAVQ